MKILFPLGIIAFIAFSITGAQFNPWIPRIILGVIFLAYVAAMLMERSDAQKGKNNKKR